MKLLVFGSNSQLGQDLVRLLAINQVDFESLTTDEVDVLAHKEVVKAVSRANPTQLINVSTYINLQKVENDPAEARLCDLVNTEGVTSLARVCEQLSIPMIHHSSSYVFDGNKKETYTEEDEANPICRFGKSKWYGERTLREETTQHIILRTDWLFSSSNKSYFCHLIEMCKKNKGKIGVIGNRFNPTHTSDAARVIYAIAQQADCNSEIWGTYHYNAIQPVNQELFVEHVLEQAALYDKKLEKLLPSLIIENLPVELPYIRNSALNCDKIFATFGIKQRSRAVGVTAVLEEIYGIKKAVAQPRRKKTITDKEKKKNKDQKSQVAPKNKKKVPARSQKNPK